MWPGNKAGKKDHEILRIKVNSYNWSVRFMCMADEMGRWVDANESNEDDFYSVLNMGEMRLNFSK